MVTRSRQAKIGYALAAIPAVFLPVSYLTMVVWVCVVISPALVSGTDAGDPTGPILWVLQAGLCATLIQWPFYLFWAARTVRITHRIRMVWIVVLILLNMFAIPWFLLCMYRGTAQTALIRGLRPGVVRRFLEKDTRNQTAKALKSNWHNL